MHIELEKDLAVKYPSLFLKNKDITLDVGAGWYDLLDELSEKLSTYPVSYANVYEKLGELEIHLRVPDISGEDAGNLSHLLQAAKDEAHLTCSFCGEYTCTHLNNCTQ